VFYSQAQLTLILIQLLDHILPAFDQVLYRLVGTAASVLHGVEVAMHDIDLLAKERAGVDLFGALMAPHFPCIVSPALLPGARQYFCAYAVAGTTVEMSTVEAETDSDAMECVGRGPWEHFRLLPCGIYRVPTVSLELRLVSELVRDRTDRFIPLVRYMQQHGCDLRLVERGMQARRLDPELQLEILTQLGNG
jgi:hypothetical protein